MKNKAEEMQMCQEVGRRLSEMRKMNDLTQTDVAEHLGISQSNVSQLENDTRKFSVYSIKKLLELYGGSYESVLGELGSEKHEAFQKPESTLESINLLMSVCDRAESDDLTSAVSAYINMCVYVLLRELYEANPRNTDAVFSVDKNTAIENAMRFIANSPYQISSYINASTGKVRKTAIEPPLEKAADFREFIKTCESYITKYIAKNK